MSNYYVYLQVWSTQLQLIVLYAHVPSIWLSTICHLFLLSQSSGFCEIFSIFSRPWQTSYKYFFVRSSKISEFLKGSASQDAFSASLPSVNSVRAFMGLPPSHRPRRAIVRNVSPAKPQLRAGHLGSGGSSITYAEVLHPAGGEQAANRRCTARSLPIPTALFHSNSARTTSTLVCW